jgi:hypothetical protein
MILGILLVLVPAAAVLPPQDHTVVRMFFEKGGEPYNGSVTFSVTCYGMDCDGRDCRESAKVRLARSGQVIYSGVCNGYGCIHSITTSPFTGIYTRCDLNGTADGVNFTLPDYADTPFGKCIDFRHNYGKYYYQPPEYDQCMAHYQQVVRLCDSYAVSCNPPEAGCALIPSGRYGKETDKFRACIADATPLLEQCTSYLKKMDTNSIILWKDSRGWESIPDFVCGMNLTIPSGEETSARTPLAVSGVLSAENTVNLTSLADKKQTAGSMNPVESFYCSIISIFGARC